MILDEASGNSVQGNKIGTDPAGAAALANSVGVLLGYSSSANNTVGGLTQSAGNLISGNSGDGILVVPTIGAGNAIQGNLIGTDVTGKKALANGGNGVEIQASGIMVGGPVAGAGNVISGNAGSGIEIDPSSNFGKPRDE